MGSVLHFRKMTLGGLQEGWIGCKERLVTRKPVMKLLWTPGQCDLNWCDLGDGKEGMDVRAISRWNRWGKWLNGFTCSPVFIHLPSWSWKKISGTAHMDTLCLDTRSVCTVGWLHLPLITSPGLEASFWRNGPMDSEHSSGWGLSTFPALLSTSHTDSGLQGLTWQYCPLSQHTAPPCLARNAGGGH